MVAIVVAAVAVAAAVVVTVEIGAEAGCSGGNGAGQCRYRLEARCGHFPIYNQRIYSSVLRGKVWVYVPNLQAPRSAQASSKTR